MLFEHLSIFGADQRFDFLEVVLQVIEHTGKHRAILRLPVQLVEHLIRIADGSNRLIGTGVGPTRPGVSAIRNHHAKLE